MPQSSNNSNNTFTSKLSGINLQSQNIERRILILMNFIWLDEINEKSVFSDTFDYQYTHKKTLRESKLIENVRILSTVEQLLISRYYVFNQDGLSDIIANVEDFGTNKMEQYIELFNTVRYFYNHEILRFVKVSNPKLESLELFKEQIKSKRISEFVRSIYLTPHESLSFLSNPELFSETHLSNLKRIGFSLNTDFVNRIDLNEITIDLLDFLKCCHPTGYGVEPNRLIMNEDILNNYAVRLLSTIYENVYFIVDKETRRIIYVLGR